MKQDGRRPSCPHAEERTVARSAWVGPVVIFWSHSTGIYPLPGLTLSVFSVKSIDRGADNHDDHVDAAYQENPRDDCGSEGIE